MRMVIACIHFMQALFAVSFRMKFHNTDNLPEGGVIICANHTSLIDPVFIVLAMKKRAYQKLKIIAKIELKKNKILHMLIGAVLIYVDRGKSDIAAIKETISMLKDGNKLIIFPEGTRVNPEESMAAKTGISMFALKSGVPVLPVYITAGKKPLFSFKKVDVVFGEAYYPEKRADIPLSEAYREIADDIMVRIRVLKPQE